MKIKSREKKANQPSSKPILNVDDAQASDLQSPSSCFSIEEEIHRIESELQLKPEPRVERRIEPKINRSYSETPQAFWRVNERQRCTHLLIVISSAVLFFSLVISASTFILVSESHTIPSIKNYKPSQTY